MGSILPLDVVTLSGEPMHLIGSERRILARNEKTCQERRLRWAHACEISPPQLQCRFKNNCGGIFHAIATSNEFALLPPRRAPLRAIRTCRAGTLGRLFCHSFRESALHIECKSCASKYHSTSLLCILRVESERHSSRWPRVHRPLNQREPRTSLPNERTGSALRAILR